ncbi:hypothetical protein COOONC_25322 [Cooperia oncophora]
MVTKTQKQPVRTTFPPTYSCALPAGTGGTITSVARYTKRYNLNTTIVLADSEYSLYFDYVIANRWVTNCYFLSVCKPRVAMSFGRNQVLKGTGYGLYVEPLNYRSTTSLDRGVIDEAMKMPDIATAASMYVLRDKEDWGRTISCLGLPCSSLQGLSAQE